MNGWASHWLGRLRHFFGLGEQAGQQVDGADYQKGIACFAVFGKAKEPGCCQSRNGP
jgi:hypothetical protein